MTESTTQTLTEPTTHSLEVPGAVLTYDVRPSASSTEPVLVLIGSPMGAAGFGSLARHFTDRTVVTYDPRGVEAANGPTRRRSRRRISTRTMSIG